MNVVKVGLPFHVKVNAGYLVGAAAGFSYSILDMGNASEILNNTPFSEPISGFYTAPVTLSSVGEFVIIVRHTTLFVQRIPISVKAESEDLSSLATAASISALATDIRFLKNMEGGRWKIINNQMVFFAEDNTTEVARFNLTDATGTPTETNVMERTRV